jgi:hypothetical protein
MALRGYLLMVGVMAMLLTVAYLAARWVAVKGTYFLTGLFPILLTIFVCFCLVCAFDAVFDRVSSRLRASRDAASRDPQKP